MDILKAEILRKKKTVEDQKLISNDTKYFKRADLKRKEDEEYCLKHKYKKIVDSAENSPGRNSPIPDALNHVFKEKTDGDKEKTMPRHEVVRLLRSLLQPVRLFGESDMEAYHRLRKLQVNESETLGLRNDFRAALEKVEVADVQDLYSNNAQRNHNSDDTDKKSSLEVTIKEDHIDDDEIVKLKDTLMDAITKDAIITPDSYEAQIVLRYLKFILSVWGRELNSRPRDEKLSFKGKMASATYSQTVEYIKPLFRALKMKSIPPDILDSLIRMVALCMDRNYIKANDKYVEIAIGNAPWPLGVTHHGIHSRTALEKIHAKNVAHVLNDESQRKYIQAIKRIMTQCQRLFPTAPHRCVNYMGNS